MKAYIHCQACGHKFVQSGPNIKVDGCPKCGNPSLNVDVRSGPPPKGFEPAGFKYQLEFTGLTFIALFAMVALAWTDKIWSASACLGLIALDFGCAAINQYLRWRKP